MKPIKIIAFCIGTLFLLFGFIGFMYVAANAMATQYQALSTPLPINQVNGMAVDSKGQIHIGDSQTSSIQTFDSSGRFLYGFTFPTGGAGWFAFGMDTDDAIHIVTARTDAYLKYKDGQQLLAETIDDLRQTELENAYHMGNASRFSRNGTEYRLLLFDRLEIRERNGGKSVIILEAPYWPLPIWVFWLIAAIGMGLWFYSFAWKFMTQMSVKAKRYNLK